MLFRILFILFCFLELILSAQNSKTLIFGYVKDAATDIPIQNIDVYIDGNEKVGTITNKEGYYELQIAKIPSKIIFSHIAYEPQQLKVEQPENHKVDIELITKYHTIGVAEITASAKKIINDKTLYVLDYELFGDNLMLIAHHFAQKPDLYLMTIGGDTLARTQINETPVKLHKDCFGNIHLITEKHAFQIFYENNSLNLIYPISVKEFSKKIEPIITKINDKLFYKEYFVNNQVLIYYYREKDSTDKKLSVIADENSLRMLSDRERFMSMGKAYTDADMRFEELFFYDPIFSPLFNINDTLIILNFIDSKIEFFNSNCNLIKEVNIDFHKEKNWKEDIITDTKTGNFYSLYRKNGIARLLEIDINKGKTGRLFTIPNFIFIDKIRVHNNKIFFLDSDQKNNELQMLYIQNLN
ncbi:MAG: hypothetical protein A2046_03220 [Bacteroidetes bacterium GWA2_30_7]|nr:MAG: hypothetical protein A2046_03220 [Bacteroidetes bacterium GWA2_30_7]